MDYSTIDNISDLQNEIWEKLIIDKYKISNLGRIKIYSLNKPAMISTPSIDNAGYPLVGLFIHGKYYYHRVHRLLAQIFIPNPNNYPIVNHKNGIKYDNRIENLEWCTYKHNSNGARIGKPGVLGERHPFAKFTNKQVLYIFNSNKSGVALAKKYGVTTISISSIKTGKAWSHVTGKMYVNKDRHWIEFDGKRMMLSDWARLFKITHTSLLSKIKITPSFEEVYNYYQNKNNDIQ